MKKTLSLSMLLISVLLIFSNYGYSQELTSKQIDSLVAISMKTIPQVGIAIGVVKDGKIVHLKGYGFSSAETKEKVNENTLFAIASNSKAFTTAALSILVDEGKLNWLDKVVDYIPEFKMYDPYITANFNIQDLLTHRSGLGLGAGDLMFFPDGSDFTIKDILKSFQYQKQVSAFRTKYDYDNLLYIVAGEVVARISGISWAEFVENRIMKPLEMKRSVGVFENLKVKSNFAFPHSTEKDIIKQIMPYNDKGGTLGAAGGIYSSVNDMCKWMIMHLNGGKYGKNLDKQLFSAKNQKEMWRPHTNQNFNIKPNPRTKTHLYAYGLGWGISDVNGYITVGHTGGLPGMLSRVIMIPELNVGVVVLTNSLPGGYSFMSISQTILDSYLGIEKMDWINRYAKFLRANEANADSVTNAVWETVKTVKSKNVDYKQFVGTYKDNWFGKVDIFPKGKDLWFKSYRSPKLNGKMYLYKATTFAIKWEYTDMPCDAFATFSLDTEGKAVGIKMKGISPNIDFSFDFHDLDLHRVDSK